MSLACIAARLWRRTVPILLASLIAAVPAGAISSRTLIAPKGGAANDQLGRSVASLGDVNGDGYPDVIAGAINAGGNGTASIYYGGPAADAIADVVLTGEAAGSSFGSSVAGLGDINTDGYPDVIVGAPGHNGSAGRAYVFLGGTALVTKNAAAADVILTGEAANNLFGGSVSTAGDVNGDGRPDVIVGAASHNSSAGRAYVFFAGATFVSKPAANADVIITGEAGSWFGYSVAAAGDVGGDGRPDVVIGAFGQNGNTGRAYVFFGGRTFTGSKSATNADVILTGEGTSNFFGVSVASAGDMNGDGRGDLVVGASFVGGGTGRAYVFHGGPLLVTKGAAGADAIITGITATGALGNAVCGAGDVNGDGRGDILVSAPSDLANAGRVYLFLGKTGFTGSMPASSADRVFTGEAAGDQLGTSLAAAGDVDGDGFADVITGAGAYNASAGRAYVDAIYPYRVVSPNGGERWSAGRPATVRWLGHDPADVAISTDGGASWSVLMASAGGLEDNRMTITAPSETTEGALIRVSYAGVAVGRGTSDGSDGAFTIARPAALPAIRREETFAGVAAGGYFGASVADLGDVNGDGYSDMLVGAPEVNSSAGAAYVYFGGPGADANADVVLTGEAGSGFGDPVAAAGDVNGDGYQDLLISARRHSSNRGRVYLFRGGPGLVSEGAAGADAIVSGEGSFHELGYSISTAGDLNRDGIADVILGAPGASSNAGRAYVFFGGASLTGSKAATDANVIVTGEANTTLGTGVASAGDVNGDGRDDLLLGAYQFNVFGGKAYVLYGRPSLLGSVSAANADVILTSEASGHQFGGDVAGAGDVNGDGFADVIVGAVGYASNRGRAYVFFGGPLLGTRSAAAADVVLTGEIAGANFGSSLAMGDIDADGLADLIVGAPNFETFQGRVYAFLGGTSLTSRSALDADRILLREGTNENFGQSVCVAADPHQDGFSNVLIGAPGSGTGRTYVFDADRYHVLAPAAGDTWNVGAAQTIAWLGAERADVWLSTDGGGSYQLLRHAVGGEDHNAMTERVPHLPTRFARIKLTPADAGIEGGAASDSLFTIRSSVELLGFRAEPGQEGGMRLAWSTDPAVGPAGIEGYCLYRTGGEGGAAGVRIGPDLITEPAYTDAEGDAGSGYRLSAINGLGEETEIGQIAAAPVRMLAAGPLPYRGGDLRVSFTVSGPLGARSGEAEVAIHDVVGRVVKVLAQGSFGGARQTVVWDGRDARGAAAPAGVYFLRARSGGHTSSIKMAVLR